VKLGVVLAIASWATMALIVSILGFMMDPGSWHSDRTLFSGMLNPLYLPQLAFRTPLAMLMAGSFGLVIVPWVTERGSQLRTEAIRTIGRWMLAWTIPCVLGGLWYIRAVPDAMANNLAVALLTQALEGWANTAIRVLMGACLVITGIALWAARWPKSIRPPVLVTPAILAIVLLGTFERVREFVRKPYAIAGYLYSNGLRVDDYPLLQRDGILTHATYTTVRRVTPDNQIAAGREVFNLACTRCHTVDGVNGIRDVLARMYGDDSAWNSEAIVGYVGAMHEIRPFMPPFPGNEAEKRALAAFLVSLQFERDVIEGAQVTGVEAPPRPTSPDPAPIFVAI